MTTAQLAKLVRATPRWILKLTADGVLHRAQDADGSELRGRYSAHAIGDFCAKSKRVKSKHLTLRQSTSDQMKMVAHQNKTQNRRPETLRRFAQQFHEPSAIPLIMENRLASVAPRAEMIDRIFDSMRRGRATSSAYRL